jgi:hypothetical protein
MTIDVLPALKARILRFGLVLFATVALPTDRQTPDGSGATRRKPLNDSRKRCFDSIFSPCCGARV